MERDFELGVEDHAHLQAVMLVEVVWVLFVVKLVWPSTW